MDSGSLFHFFTIVESTIFWDWSGRHTDPD